MESPLSRLPGAVAATDIDTGLAWHYGDPFGEQRVATSGAGLLDTSNREIISVTGDDRLTWLHNLTSQHFHDRQPWTVTQTLVLSATGHIEHGAEVTCTADAVLLSCDPRGSGPLLAYLESMIFWSKVAVARTELVELRLVGPRRHDIAEQFDACARGLLAGQAATLTTAEGGFLRVTDTAIDVLLPADRLAWASNALLTLGAKPAGTWAGTALRIAARIPRLGLDTDERTIPNETPLLGTAVHLDKGCYRGQETVARVHNLGRPPRRTVVLNLDGSMERLPETGSAVLTRSGRTVGRVGSVAQHFEEGPIALALVKSAVGPDTALLADGVDAVVDQQDVPPEQIRWERPSLPDLKRR